MPDGSTPGIEIRPDRQDMTTNRPLLRGLLHRRPGAGRRTWSASRATPSSRRWRQLEHERGGIDRLMSRIGPCTTIALEPGRSLSDPLIRQEVAAHGDRLPGRSAAGLPGACSKSGAGRDSAPPPSASAPSTSGGWLELRVAVILGAGGHAVRRRRTVWSTACMYAPGYTIHGRDLQRDAEHPG